tara:strand:+ start:48302 stop:49816 length:1515 start_codon:yes stop_codon:yes gene_type:complete
MGSSMGFLKLEVVIVALLGLAFKSILKDKWYSYVLASVPILFFYFFFNEFYIYFDRFPKISDVNEIPEMFSVISTFEVFLTLIVAICYFSLLIWAIDINKLKRPYLLVSVFLLLIISVKVSPKLYINLFEKLNFEYITWDLKKTVVSSGYLNFILYEEASKNYLFKELAKGSFSKKDSNQIPHLQIDPSGRLKNIHLIVLESFYDPNMFEGITYSVNPIHPSFETSVYPYKNYSVAPVYAGGTPQSEFELLTGVPALALFGSVEFNFFTGAKVKASLPNQLREAGYYTVATNGLTPDIFNSYNAYKGLGFEEQNYINGTTYLRKKKENLVIFDGDLFDQNLKYIDSVLQAKPFTPIFNYVMGMYGHSPFELDKERHPSFIEVFKNGNKLKNSRFERSVNQIYYRTEAISKYIDRLIALDPNSMIIIIGDHLPKIDKIKDLGYQLDNTKRLPFYVIKDSNPVKLEGEFKHFEIPHLIIEYLNKKKVINEKDYETIYMQILYQAIK